MAQRKSGPLRGLRVVLLPRQMAAKMTGMILADYGASVVELREAGFEPGPGWEIAEQVWTRGKMMTPFEDGAQLDALLGEAELFITDWSTEALEQIGCGPNAALTRHPALVTVQISGYGITSVRQAEDWSEALVAASLGLPWAQEGRRGEEEPHMPTFMVGSAATAFNAVTGAMAGLHHRCRTGHGQVVDTSLVDGMAAQQTLGWAWAESIGSERRSPQNDIERGSLGRLVLKAFRCEDGGWIHVHTGAKGAFSRLVALAGLETEIPPLPVSGQSEMGQPITPQQLTVLHQALPKMFAGKPRAQWLSILRQLDIPCMPDLRCGEILQDPQALENQFSALVELVDGEAVRAAGIALKFSETPGLPGEIARATSSTEEAVAEMRYLGQLRPPPSEPSPPQTDYPLAGVRALDFGIYYAGPFATRLLADLGAEVIKLENLFGCPMRAAMNGRMFNAGNRSKRMLAMNLKRPEARGVIEALIRSVDIVHHNMRPGVAEGLGMGYENLRRINPKLIYCHSPAYGSLGPYRGYPGFEPLSSAAAGLLMRYEDSETSGPHRGVGSMDPGNGMLGAAGLLMALHHRDRTGEGQYVECPQLGSAILSTCETVIRADGRIEDPIVADSLQLGYGWWARLYQTADGWTVVDAASGAQRRALLQLAGAQEDRAASQIANWALNQTTAGFLAALKLARVTARPVGDRYEGQSYFSDPENRRLNRVVAYKGHPLWGEYHELSLFWRFPGLSLRTGGDAWFAQPIGQHSRDILAELGVNPTEIDELFDRKVVATA